MRVFLIFLVAISLLAVGCAIEPTTTRQSNGNATGNRSANSNANSNSAIREAPIAWAVTLPVLDAFLSDESFVAEVKSELQLTDAHISALRDASSKATMEMDARAAETSADARESRMRAVNEVDKVIGPEKSKQLLEMVAERWAGADPDSLLVSRPGVPPVDTRIVVNIPAFRMDLFETGKLIKSYKVGIGYPEFPLPTGVRRADQILFNPPWTPPNSPWVEKMKGITSGETIKPGDRRNPLGILKVPIGLPSLIHGGKPLAKIGTFASHGCVGLTDAQAKDFAKYLAQMGGAELTDAQIAAYARKRTQTETIKLARPVLVELRYESIVIEDGAVHIYRDVYSRGTNTESDLRAAFEAAGSSVEQLSGGERSQLLAMLNEMSRDPSGKMAPDAASNSNAAAANRGGSAAKDRGESNKNGRVTRTIKGQTEAVVAIASLSGKGYPRPADMNDGRGR